MAKLNRTLVLNHVAVTDNVVTTRMGIGSNLALVQALASLSQFWPDLTGPEPTSPNPRMPAMVGIDYRDPSAMRAGRSVRPAGCTSLDLAALAERSTIVSRFHELAAIATKRQFLGQCQELSGRKGRPSGR